MYETVVVNCSKSISCFIGKGSLVSTLIMKSLSTIFLLKAMHAITKLHHKNNTTNTFGVSIY